MKRALLTLTVIIALAATAFAGYTFPASWTNARKGRVMTNYLIGRGTPYQATVPNPAYDPRQTIPNPAFDPLQPESPQNPATIANPAYNPNQTIPNPVSLAQTFKQDVDDLVRLYAERGIREQAARQAGEAADTSDVNGIEAN